MKGIIDHLKKEVQELRAEKAKSKPAGGRKYSSRQESDKKAAGGRVAYIKERQRRGAAKARAAGLKERATKKLANEEAYEREFNEEGRGRKRPASEVKRQQTKRTREKEKKKRKLRRKRLKGLRTGREKKMRKRRRREEEKRRKKTRKKGPQAVAVSLRRARVFLRSPSTHPWEEWALHLQMMKRTEVCCTGLNSRKDPTVT